MASLASEIHMSASEVHAGLHRAMYARLYDIERRQVRVDNFEEFLFHGLQYCFVLTKGPITRGLPTSMAAPPLNKHFDEPDYPPVWPHSQGTKRGYSVDPLYKNAPDAAAADPEFYELLSLVDGIRDESARIRKLAKDELSRRLEGYRKRVVRAIDHDT
jgi:hypothetical protein